jgi:tRNA pseudouridine synthase 8/2,5-diamino-6-(5-phospho-D-ribitylamino)-pyrimidin-4(3H)-one deaminase
VNGVQVTVDYLVKSGDLISNRVHRHEPAVSSEPVSVWNTADDLVLTSKPSSMPIHPCGRYHFNSLVYALAKEHSLFVHPIHRLDRLTSGLCLFAKDAMTAREVSQKIRERNVEKYYLARIRGKFPDGDSTSDELHTCFLTSGVQALVDEEGRETKELVVDKPIYCSSQRLSKHDVPAEDDLENLAKAKACRSVFRRLSYDGLTSVVLCRLFTGRTHQLRVHLSWLGFPIANDPNYGGILCVGNSRSPLEVEGLEFLQKCNKISLNPQCWECDSDKSIVLANSKPDQVYCTEIWLHSLRYCSNSWEYQVPAPSWAAKEFSSSQYLQPVTNVVLAEDDEIEEPEKS